MYTFVEVFQAVGSRKLTYDDDVVDRLSHRYTVYIIVCFALVITTYQYVGEYTVSQYSLMSRPDEQGFPECNSLLYGPGFGHFHLPRPP